MRTRWLGVSLLIVLTTCLDAGGQGLSPAVPPALPVERLTEHPVAQLSAGADLDGAISSRSRVAWIEKKDGHRTVWLDGTQQGGVYENVSHLRFTRDEAQLMFAAQRRGRWVVVTDGREQSPEYTTITSFAFQPRGESVAYGACEQKRCQLVVDGKPLAEVYEDISFPRYSRDGHRLAFVAKRGRSWQAVVDGKQLEPGLAEVAWMAWGFDDSGTRFYIAGRVPSGRWTYAVDGSAGPEFDVISPIAFTGDGVHYAYGGTNARMRVFRKNQTQGTIVIDGAIAATHEGSGFGGWGEGMGNAQIATGVREFRPGFHGVSAPRFRRDGELVYAAVRGEQDVAVFVGGESGPGFDDVVSPVIFSGDGQRIAYVAKRGDRFVEIRDHRPGASFPAYRTISFVSWMYSDCTGSLLAYETVRGGDQFNAGLTRRALRQVIVNGRPGREYNANGIAGIGFAVDGRHHWYEVHGAQGSRARVVIDGQESRLYDSVFPNSLTSHTTGRTGNVDDQRADVETFAGTCGPRAPDAERLQFVARDGSRLLRVGYAFPAPEE